MGFNSGFKGLIKNCHNSHLKPHTLRSLVQIPPGAWIFVCCECRVLSGRGLCDELITRPEESYRLCCVVVCDLETPRMGAPYIYDISRLRVNIKKMVYMLTDVKFFLFQCSKMCCLITLSTHLYMWSLFYITTIICHFLPLLWHMWVLGCVKSNPITGLYRHWGFQEVQAPRFQDNQHMKVVRLSALHTGRLYPPGNIPGTHFH